MARPKSERYVKVALRMVDTKGNQTWRPIATFPYPWAGKFPAGAIILAKRIPYITMVLVYTAKPVRHYAQGREPKPWGPRA